MSGVTNIECFQGKNDQWYWRAKAANGEIVATSEAYKTKQHVLRAVESTWPDHVPVKVIE